LIRGHLRAEAAKFTAGDFSDAAATHGQDMPGLAPLELGSGHITFVFESLPAGARITYRSSDPALWSRRCTCGSTRI